MEQESAVQQTLDSLHNLITDSASFSAAVALISTDDVTRAYKGDMGWQLAAQVDPTIRENFGGVFLTGSLSKVFRVDNSFFLYRVLSYEQNRPMTLEDDYNSILRYAERIESQKKLKDLITSWRKDVFIKKY